VITNKLIDRNVKLTCLLYFPDGSTSSKILLLVAVLAILGALTACGDAHLPLLMSIQVTPANSTIDIGETQQFTAVGTFSDGNTRDLTSLVTWSSSNTTVAAISSSGLALGQGQGSSRISATLNTADGPVTGATALGVIVTLTSLTITPVNPSIANDTSLQLTATGTFSDGSTQNLTTSVTWTSSAAAIATVSSSGLVTGTGVGGVTISATQAGVSGTTTVTVTAAVLTSITITPANSAIANGTSKQLIATGNFSDGTTQDLTAFVTWASSAPSLAAISNAAGSQGLVTGGGAGSATISATLAGVSGTTTITVTAAVLTSISVTPSNPSIANGTSKQLIATGNFSDGTTQDLTTSVTWASSAPSLAAVSNAAGSQGLVTGGGAGSATISATLAGVSGATTVTVTAAVLTSITITPPNSAIANGTSKQLIATGNFSDGTTQDLTASVTWASSAPSLAAVSNAAGSQGLVTGGGAGSATITATQAGVSGTTTVTVTAAVLTSITITPPNSAIAKGTSKQLIATGNFSDGTTQDLTASVAWVSSDPTLATVSNAPGSQGQVTGAALGSTTITATQGALSGRAAVTVTAAVLTAITITPPNSAIANGTTEQLTAMGAFSDGTTQDLTSQVSWSSSSDSMATVSGSGLVTGTGLGSPTMTATLAGVSGSAAVTVTAAVLTSLTVTPANTSIPVGTGEQLIATGTFSDGTTKDLTTSVTWGSSDATLAIVSSAAGSQGFVTGTGMGGVTISAVLPGVPGVTGSASVTVTAAILTSIAVIPANPSIADGGTIPLTATGTFSDGSMKVLTSQVSWISSSDTIAHVDNTPVSPGLVTGTGVGSPTITATLGTVTGGTIVTVLAACNVGDSTSVAAYNAIPFNAANCLPPAYGFESSTFNELGNGVNLATGTGRSLVSLNVVFRSFACGVSGTWYDPNNPCVTDPANPTFQWPITANIYAVQTTGCPQGVTACPGPLLATISPMQTIPFRPSADPVHCPGTPYQWFNPNDITDNVTSPGKCESGIATVLTFNFPPGVTLPDQVIWTVAFNTTDFGPSPIGTNPACSGTPAGCPYDALNVGVKTYSGSPYAGSSIDPNGAFLNAISAGAYCDNGAGGTDFLRLDTPCWTLYTPLGEIITH
jgi:uncharacterized protein YjdB